MTVSTGYQLSYTTDDHGEGQNEMVRWTTERLHGAVDTPFSYESDVQELLSRFLDKASTIMERVHPTRPVGMAEQRPVEESTHELPTKEILETAMAASGLPS